MPAHSGSVQGSRPRTVVASYHRVFLAHLRLLDVEFVFQLRVTEGEGIIRLLRSFRPRSRFAIYNGRSYLVTITLLLSRDAPLATARDPVSSLSSGIRRLSALFLRPLWPLLSNEPNLPHLSLSNGSAAMWNPLPLTADPSTDNPPHHAQRSQPSGMAPTPHPTPPPSPQRSLAANTSSSQPPQRQQKSSAVPNIPPRTQTRPKIFKKRYFLPPSQINARIRLCHELPSGKAPPAGAIEVVLKVPVEYNFLEFPEALKIIDAEGRAAEMGKGDELEMELNDEFNVSLLDWKDVRDIEDRHEAGEWGLGDREVWDRHAVRAWKKFVGSREAGCDIWGVKRKVEEKVGLLGGDGTWSPRGSYYGDRPVWLATAPVVVRPNSNQVEMSG
ncbi:hypothetical protein FN846DRAFT_363555 [Sphaerosporella brunnea]|uniref:Uncharacterized protein n=1 Tax=Sphaerosporella brunnea TaxID=1250544 RepID=A0A5J5EJ26_9PEZI|nr:hypothetical protein FN846DRAFT_363555 [Sphaerosporella brunnea]